MLATYEILGRIVDIIKSNITFTYDTIEDMRNSIYLHENMTVKTLGYYSKRDGGAAYYIIEKKQELDTDNGCDCIIVGYRKNLVARFFPQNGVLNVLQFGIIQGSTLYDSMFNNERMRYCEEYATDNGIGLLYPNKFSYRDGHRYGKVYGHGIIKTASSSVLDMEYSIPIPSGIVAPPVDRGMYLEGSFTLYNVNNTYTGTFTKSNHSSTINGLSMIISIHLSGNFSSWVNSKQVTILNDFTRIYMKDTVIKS